VIAAPPFELGADQVAVIEPFPTPNATCVIADGTPTGVALTASDPAEVPALLIATTEMG
jgi:hypothetical protein